MKAKTKLIMSIMSICLVCAVFAIGVFALKTANLKIGGNVSFNATGVEAHIKNASLTGVKTTNQTIAASDEEGEYINTTMTQSDINETFVTWQNLTLDFNSNGNDIVFKFNIANTSTNIDNYIEMDYDYSFTTENPNVDVFPGETTSGTWANNNYILTPKGSASKATYSTFTLKFKVLDKELNVKAGTKVNLTISLKHSKAESINLGEGSFVTAMDEEISPYYIGGNLIYSVETQTNTATLIGYQNNPASVVVPAVVKYNNVYHRVTAIGSGALASQYNETTGEWYSSITSLYLPSSITSFQAWAFCEIAITSLYIPKSVVSIGEESVAYNILTSINIPNSVTSIGEKAFNNSIFATSITISQSLTSIPDYAFKYSSNLTSIVIPNKVVSIGREAFGNCENLQQVIIPNGVKSIGNWAFTRCEKLSSLRIPKTLEVLGAEVFGYCNLNSIVVEDGNPIYDSRYNCNAIIETATNILHTGSATTVIPYGIVEIDGAAFSARKGLTTIEIPNTVEKIGVSAFRESGLISLIIPESVNEIQNVAFDGCDSLESVTFLDTEGWSYGFNDDMDMTDPRTNATNLRKSTKAWYKD